MDDFVIAYINDIIIFSDTLEEHENHVHLVLQKLEEAKLLVNPEKCVFHSQRVEFLGYVITLEQIHMNPDKVTAIKE